jgi:hypothetical protein
MGKKPNKEIEKEEKSFNKIRPWILAIVSIAFITGGLIRIFITGPAFGINQTKMQFQVKDGYVHLLFGIIAGTGLLYTLKKRKK